MKLEKPKLTGKTDKENLHLLETWATNLVDKLNYAMSHIDDKNFTENNFVSQEMLKKEMQGQYKELRELIIERTKGG